MDDVDAVSQPIILNPIGRQFYYPQRLLALVDTRRGNRPTA